MKLTAANLAGSNSSRGRAENDYYATPPIATELLLNELRLGDDTILEPAAGEGHIVKVLKEHYPYNEITATDLVERSSRFGIDVSGGINFLSWQPDRTWDTIITIIWMINRYVLYVFIVALAIDRLIVKHHEYI